MATDASPKASTLALLDRLAADAAPVRPRRTLSDALALAGVMLAELLLALLLLPPRPDVALAVEGPMFWWKLLGSAALAAAGVAAFVAVLVPQARPGSVRRTLTAATLLTLAAGVVALLFSGAAVSAQVLDWREGLACVALVLAYALPVWIAAILIARRAAPARPATAAGAAGFAGAGWGAAVFAWTCPHDDLLYVAVWYGIALAIGAGLVRLTATRWLRW